MVDERESAMKYKVMMKKILTTVIVASMMLSLISCGTASSETVKQESMTETSLVAIEQETQSVTKHIEESFDDQAKTDSSEDKKPESTQSTNDMENKGEIETSAVNQMTIEETTAPIEETIEQTKEEPTQSVVESLEAKLNNESTKDKSKTEEEELTELYNEEQDGLSDTQRNAINMLNYMTVLTQEINDSKESRLYLESAYSSLMNNIYPNAVDTKTQAQINGILDTLENYRMINVKRERLDYIYEQNKAQALRQAIPSPVALLSVVQSGNLLKAAASVLYMAVDSATSYTSATSQADLQYLKDGWELDDKEAEELHNSRKNALNYMFNMVRDNSLPGDFALNEDSVGSFVDWKNKTNLTSKIAWFESNEKTYQEFGPYWLEMAKEYYDSGEYRKCLKAFAEYENVNTRILRQDFDYAKAAPMAIIAAKETMGNTKYVETAEKYLQIIKDNTKDTDWSLRYFAAQIYLDLYKTTEKKNYLNEAYKLAFDNVNCLIDTQKELNQKYLEDIVEIKPESDATKREKEEVKQYNKMLKAARKVELPPVSEALYLNCDLLFALAGEKNISNTEKNRVDSILHENGERIFLTEALDDRFWFNPIYEHIDAKNINITFDGKELTIPAICISDRSQVIMEVEQGGVKTTIADWKVESVTRKDKNDCTSFLVLFTSEMAKKYKYKAGDNIVIKVIPVAEAPNEAMVFDYDVIATKVVFVFDGIAFERKY